MAKVVVVGSESYGGTQASVNTALNSINSSGAITLVVSADNTFAANYGNIWAQTNGVPWLDMGPIIRAQGYDPIRAPLAAMQQSNPSHVLTLGSHARTTAASGAAVARGHTVVPG